MGSNFKPFGFYLLRVPRLSSEMAHKINEFRSKKELWDYIVHLLKDPEKLEAIYLASENLFEELTGVISCNYTPSRDKILETLYKYISRMAVRATPYGKFSGVSLGDVSELPTSIQLSGELISTYRLDMGFTAHLSRLALENLEIQKELVYYTNTTLYESVDHFKYIDFQETDNKRYYQWAKVAKNPLLKFLLELARNGKHFQKLLGSIEELGIDEKKGHEYINHLIKDKLLISELEPCVTSFNSTDIISRLKNIRHKEFPIFTLENLDNCLHEINSNDKKIQSFTIREIFKNLKGPTNKNLFQVDMRVGASSNRINKKVFEELTKELEELSVINRTKVPNDLISFCKKFSTRYGDREVLLLEVINPEKGIGYGKINFENIDDHPLIRGLERPQKDNSHDPWQETVESLINTYELTRVRPTSPIELDYRDIQEMGKRSADCSVENYPLSFYVLGNLFLSKNQDEKKKKYKFNLMAGGGTSSIPLMTRFSHLDSRLEENIRNCVSWEENRAIDAVFAEVVYMPEGRVGNVLTRPKLFEYEIPIIGQCAVKGDFRISLDDLWISIKHGKVILRSKRLNKQIIPRLSSAHNFHYGMVVYRFLCDLQFHSNYFNLSWDWGKYSKRLFLPRVFYKHIILSRAKWNITMSSLKTLTGSDTKSKIRCMKEKFGLPNLVLLTEGDNELLVDLRSPVGGEIMLNELRKRDLILHEYLLDQYESPVHDLRGSQYNNEIIIPVKVDKLLGGTKFKSEMLETVRRCFSLGSEWVFIKIYSGISESDKILDEYVRALTNELMEAGMIEKWFFIRYHDPECHIRLRFLLPKKEENIFFQEVIHRINKYLEPLVKNDTIQRIVYDTYERELERYGQDKIEICESIFYHDSECILKLLPLFKLEGGNHLRWLTGMLGVDSLLGAFGLDIHQRISLVTMLRDAFLTEFSDLNKLKYRLDCKYRENSDRIQSIFYPSDNQHWTIHKHLLERSNAICREIETITIVLDSGYDFSDLLTSLSHMFINRLFTVKQREHEMIIYHFLVKHYQSVVKRNRFAYPKKNLS